MSARSRFVGLAYRTHGDLCMSKSTLLTQSRGRESTFATVLVGPDQTRFVVHENLLVHYSKFFHAALTGKFKEAEDKTVKLEEDDPDIFELFVHWLYYQRFPDKVYGDNEGILALWTIDDDDDYQSSPSDNCVYLHIFGDKYEVEKLRCDTINELVQMILSDPGTGLCGAASMRTAFRDLPGGSPMRQLIIDAHYRHGDSNEYDDLEDYDCIPFLHGVWRKYTAATIQAMEGDPHVLHNEIESCDYHNHKTDEEKETCKKEQEQSKKCKCGKEST
jgi:hypothetical protein